MGAKAKRWRATKYKKGESERRLYTQGERNYIHKCTKGEGREKKRDKQEREERKCPRFSKYEKYQ